MGAYIKQGQLCHLHEFQKVEKERCIAGLRRKLELRQPSIRTKKGISDRQIFLRGTHDKDGWFDPQLYWAVAFR